MPLPDKTNPAIKTFLNDIYEKESHLRAKWLHKHLEQIQQATTLTRVPKHYFETDIISHNMVGGLATLTRDHMAAGLNRREKPIRDTTFIPGVKDLRHSHSIVNVGLKEEDDPRLCRPDTDLTVDPIMRPVDPDLTEIIYKPKPEFGKAQYLAKRGKICPEKKYYFAECSAQEYGWRLKDSELHQKPIYGTCSHLNKSLRSRVGPQPDPHHYKSSKIQGADNCGGI